MESVPEREKSDHARELLIAAVGGVPWAGPMISYGLGQLWQSGHEQRIARFIESLNSRLADLEAKIGEIDTTSDAILSSASIVAQSVATSDDEKIAYLANALANVIADPDMSHDSAAVQIRLVSELTATHIRVLEVALDPEAWEQKTGNSTLPKERDGAFFVYDNFASALATPEEEVDDLRLILQDLEARGLLNSMGFANPKPTTEPCRYRLSRQWQGYESLTLFAGTQNIPARNSCIPSGFAQL